MKKNSLNLLSLCLILNFNLSVLANEIPEIQYDSFTLDNGLTVIVHEDRKVPMVAVNVWYHVGSKNEKIGKTGFAHLFEHLMFNGTENYNSEYFEPFEKIGSTDQNGTTNSDRTNYFQNVPTNALDLALWMESDRMGHILGVIDQEKLDEQRGVVQNEKRQGENSPYGKAFITIAKGAYPEGHPYSWSTIGYMEDLNAASMEDVQDWFKTYYGPNNAVLVLAGDIDLETAKEKVTTYFGDIPAGPTLTKPDTWVAKRQEAKREIMTDNVPQSRIYKVWNVPGTETDEAIFFDLAASTLTGGKNSPMYKKLVYENQIATSVSAFYYDREIAGQFILVANVAPDSNVEAVEAMMDEVLLDFLSKGPDKTLLENTKTQNYAGFVRGIQRIGGFGGKSDILATCQTYAKNPGCYKDYLETLMSTSAKDIKLAMQSWIDENPYTLIINPEEKFSTVATNVDRSAGVPYPNDKVSFAFPKVETATLNNGSKLVLATRRDVPLVEMTLMFDYGYSQESEEELGYLNFAMDMLNEGTKKNDSMSWASKIDALGSNVGYGASLDSSSISLSSLKDNLSATLDLVFETIETPTFPQAEIDRIQKQVLAGIKQEENQPTAVAFRNIGKILYGSDHPYGKPLTGSGTTETINNVTKDKLFKYYQNAINPLQTTFVVVGDISLSEAVTLLNEKTSNWQAAKTPEKVELFDVALPQTRKVYLINKPNAIQSYILAGQLVPPTGSEDEILIDYMNYPIGGSFTSRINMNLREDKSWSYGVRTRLSDAKGQRALLVTAPVQTDATIPSIKELIREYDEYLSSNPVTSDELTKAKASRTLRLPGQFETLGALLGGVRDIAEYSRSTSYLDELADLLSQPSLKEVRSATSKYVKPNQWTWLIVGDLNKIEKDIRDLGIGEVIVIDV
ncbi:MAG: pitrilysin family protein [Gammaproteobacteria bacterium]